jgi:hypothetical protein
MMRFAALLLVPSLVLIAGNPPKKTVRRGGPVNTAKEAKAIAEQETGGVAVIARRVYLNGASGGWAVDVYMPKETRGWRCIIDADTHGVHTKDRIANPKTGKSHR